MRVMIAGGGTGGHVFPGLAVAEAIGQRLPGASIRWVGTAHGLEGRMGPALGYPLTVLPVQPLKGRRMTARATALAQAARACWRSWGLLRSWRPDLVVGVGGFVAGPLTLMAALRGCPTVILEQNRIPGLTNRWLGRVARQICVTYPDSDRFFPAGKAVCTGNPIRKRVLNEFAATPARTDADVVLLVFGGSQGARAIDTAVCDMLPHLGSLAPRIRIIHQHGRGSDAERLRRSYVAAGVRATVQPFIDKMGEVYREADLVICRSGSSSLAELSCTGRPAILIPYPVAADDHQAWNARYFSDAGAAMVIPERELTGARLAATVTLLLNQPGRLGRMVEAMKGLARPDAAAQIAAVCAHLVRGRDV
ncbi:MAG: undecaprenyldiphospho-muramoylpentapeptide beta-N-acetylglucosaminyltransferase [Deltaproteobacteria bacterium]|nr:undecaprenyldiphospho-muramoylpentapeptide beta-N-acetylglucosaminyltransferase [Deltaproteobacteria bacterium]